MARYWEVCHPDRKPAVVYFATHAIPHPFWSIVIKGAMEGAWDACLEYKWTQDVEFSPTTTVERQEMAITERPDVLVITAVEPKMQQRTIKRAREAGIPIIAINVEDPGPDQGGLDYLVYIGGDEEKGGYAAADQIVKRCVEPKRAACFNACLSRPPPILPEHLASSSSLQQSPIGRGRYGAR